MASEGLITFPEDFLIGTGSGSYQVEGGWDADGKAPSIWDDYFHTKKMQVANPYETKESYTSFHRGSENVDKTQNNNFQIISGDIACDSYHKVDEDIKNLVELGVNFYRFSITWSRVLPKVDDRFPNEAGVKYYKTLIEKLLENNIQPMVTMYHWDLPAYLQVLGGWANPNIITYFSNYANFLFKTFGDKVKIWTTINEPRFVAQAYGTDKEFAPAIGEAYNGIAEYMVIRNTLLAHATAYRLYEKTYKNQQQGEICLCLDTTAYVAEKPGDAEHEAAVWKTHDFNLGMFTQPLVNGEYPKTVIDAIHKVDVREKVNFDRLPKFSEEEKKLIKGSYDFIAFNYYNSYKVRPITEEEYTGTQNLMKKDMGIMAKSNETNFNDTFKGFTQVLDWLVKNCNNPKLFVSENGFAEAPLTDKTELKIKYHKGILTEIDKALKNGVKISGYGIWSFMDSLEWTLGYYTNLFGIYSVDFNHPDRPRSKKASFNFFKDLFTTKTVQALADK